MKKRNKQTTTNDASKPLLTREQVAQLQEIAYHAVVRNHNQPLKIWFKLYAHPYLKAYSPGERSSLATAILKAGAGQ